ncbi:MAG: T9SS type A sorting domain-containing protein [Ignavibacterium sp.]|jgi:hypothetical protein|nr:T9SS type A sorting domain-containing protein [Ignavibacterium sp.]
MNLNSLGIKTLLTIISVVFFSSFEIKTNFIHSQNDLKKTRSVPDRTFHNEIVEEEFIPINRDNQLRSPAYRFSSMEITTVQVNVDENGNNIIGDAANEPSIAVDPTNLNRMAIGWRQFNTISSSFRQAGFGYSIDGGMNWTFPGVIESGIFRSDPVLESDAQGNFYYNSLTNSPEFLCTVFRSSTGGADWDAGVFAQGGDKQWMTIDNTTGSGAGNIYSQWTSAYSVCYPNFFTRSTDAGDSYEECVSIPNDPYWGTLAIGPEGELYMGGSIGFNFQVARSLYAQDPGLIVNWDLTSEVNLDGTIAYGGGPNPGGLLGQTLIAVDTSNEVTRSNVYLLCSVERISNSDPADVMFSRSSNYGISWSSPIKINDDASTNNYQWFGTMSVAPNGRIDVIWLDTRDNPGSYLSALYYSNSTDGGLTWSVNKRLSEFFDPHLGWPQQNKMGDYFDMISDNQGAFLSWAATFNNEQDVYFSRIKDTTNVVPVELVSFSSSISGNKVSLNWITATELNNHGFEIERSLDESIWRIIGFDAGKGTTTENQYYSFVDDISDLLQNKVYYRLKQIDFNGNYRYSNVIEVVRIPTEYNLAQNYPNPFNPSTIIKYSLSNQELVTLKIFDVLGKEVATLVSELKPAGDYEVNFNADQLVSGVYYYKLNAGDFVSTKKMILIK